MRFCVHKIRNGIALQSYSYVLFLLGKKSEAITFARKALVVFQICNSKENFEIMEKFLHEISLPLTAKRNLDPIFKFNTHILIKMILTNI